MAQLTQRELDTLVRITYDEARGESVAGQLGVLWVVRNRVDDSRWPANVIDVVLQDQQFEPARNANGHESLDNLTPLNNIPEAFRLRVQEQARAVYHRRPRRTHRHIEFL